MSPEETIQQLGLVLPPVPRPVDSYVNYRLTGNLLYISGNGPRTADGTLLCGKLGRDLTVEEGYEHARTAGLCLLAVAKDALGDLGRVEAVIKVLGMVNSTLEFTRHPEVINGCSDLFRAVFGPERGNHARSAVGFACLPDNMSVEIEVILQVTLPAR